MKTFLSMLVAAAAVATVYAECPNACSGHGTCGANDACACYDNFIGADCSERVCPFGLAFVDTPLGDLNHDGVVSPTAASASAPSFTSEANLITHMIDSPKGVLLTQSANKLQYEYFPNAEPAAGYFADASGALLGGLKAQNGEAHFYAECSGKGMCGRSSGLCECFDGYTGSACQRTTCPNDCSGHGSCFTVKEIAEGRAASTMGKNYRVTGYQQDHTEYEGVATKFEYNLWDADKNQACVCDRGYFGPDCSMRDCPKGRDPLSNKNWHCGNAPCAAEVQYMYFEEAAANSKASSIIRFKYTDVYGDSTRTLYSQPLSIRGGDDVDAQDIAEAVQRTITTFPGNVLGGVKVTVSAFYDASATASVVEYASERDLDGAGDMVELKIDFSEGPQGNVANLGIELLTDATNALNYQVVYADGAGAKAAAESSGNFITLGNTRGGGAANAGLTPVNGNTEYVPCSDRGLCDYSSGMCGCFSGYTGEACQLQSALIA